MPMRHMAVMQAKRFGVFSIQPEDELKLAARKMQDHNISALVVIDAEGYLAGVITRTDLVRACYNRIDWHHLLVHDFMVSDVVTVNLEDPLTRVMELLIDNHIHRVVAVEMKDGRPRPVAVLSAADIVYHMAQDK
jgi:signal-transduction protein with cAMP-binding, CBS, and nucleotidyltransferase domain